jgi:hypothetical protein
MRRTLTGRFMTTLVIAATATVTVAAPASAVSQHADTRCPLPRFGPGASYHPAIHPSQFHARITNPRSPMPVGTTYVFTGVKDGNRAVDIVAASRRTRRVDGVVTRVVLDRLYLGGRLAERTTDYYAQDRCGNVWYFGEDTAVLDSHGRVIDRSGSFHAGIDGAQPGVFMQAHPQLGRRFRQEYYRGQAEDTYRAVQSGVTVRVPYGTFHHALRTEETTRLEPGTVDNKYYVRGIGVVREVTVRGGTEQLRLSDILR